MMADGTLTTIVAVAFVIGAMAVAARHHLGSPARDPGGRGAIGALSMTGVLGTSAIMLGALVVPGFSRVTAAALTLVVLLSVVGGVAVVRMRRRRPLGNAQRSALAVTVVDIAFMSAAVVLMPSHSAAAQLTPAPFTLGPFAAAPFTAAPFTAAPFTAAAQLGVAHPGGSHLTLDGGPMIWLVLVAWAFCAAVLTVPAIVRRSPAGTAQLACSGCMITAMAAMAL